MKNKKNILSIFSGIAFVFVATTPTLAVSQAKTTLVKNRLDTLHASTTEAKAALKSNIAEIKTKTKEQIAAEVQAYKKEIETKRVAKKAEIKKEIEAFKADKKVKLDAAKKDEVKKRLATAFTKLNSSIGKLSGFDTRISAVIGTRKAKGLDTSAAESAQVIARKALDDAKIALEAVTSTVNTSIDSPLGSSKGAIKEVVAKVQESIRVAKMKYEDIIKVLPEMKEVQPSTTSTN